MRAPSVPLLLWPAQPVRGAWAPFVNRGVSARGLLFMGLLLATSATVVVCELRNDSRMTVGSSPVHGSPPWPGLTAMAWTERLIVYSSH